MDTLDRPTTETPVPPNLAWQRFSRDAAPDWVEPVTAPTDAAADGGAAWLLLDEQIRFRPVEERYRRTVFRIDNETGVDWLSEVQIVFNPSFEALALHGVTLIRQGSRSDALLDADIDFVRVEHDMHARVYRGDYVVIVQIRGLEPGDLIDTAFTVSGVNPVFGGRPLQHLPLDFPQTIGRHRIRLIDAAAAGAGIFEKGRPVQSERSQGLLGEEVVLDRTDVRRRDIEPSTPAEHDDQTSAWVVSGFQSWAEVATWGAGLYVADAADPGVASLFERIETEAATGQERVLAAIAYVQDRIRYVSTNFGEGGHRPRPPSVTIARRYGDCKDKSLLLVALLRRLGHEAGVALVSMSRPGGPLVDPPSPASFDHVIVWLRLNGETHWIDATARSQAGALSVRSRPHHGAALRLIEGQAAPERLPDPSPDAVGSFSTGEIDLSQGPGRPVTMSYVNTYVGGDAERTRHMLATFGRERLAEIYLDHVSETQGAVEQAGDFEVEDDTVRNRILIRNRLRLLNPWTEIREGWRFRYVICFATTLLPPVGAARRIHPLTIEMHPLHHRHTEVLVLPRGRRPKGLVEGEQAVTNAGFTYRRAGRLLPRRRFEVMVETRTTAFDIAPSEIIRAQRDELALRDAHELIVDFPRRRSWF